MDKPSPVATTGHINLSLLERRTRITTGLIMAAFILLHLGNHTLGLVSLELMENTREIVSVLWHGFPGAYLLYGSILTHFLLALLSLYRRKTLTMPRWEFWQLLLGLSIIPLLAGHVAHTWGSRELFDKEVGYISVLSALHGDDWLMLRQILLLMVAWIHVCIGLHFFLRLFKRYRRSYLSLYPLVILLPLLVVFSIFRVGDEVEQKVAQQETQQYGDYDSDYGSDYDDDYDSGYSSDYEDDGYADSTPGFNSDQLANFILLIFYGLLGLTLLLRLLRQQIVKGKPKVCIRHANGQELKGEPGQSILEVVRNHHLAHASVCGGRGRCTTCRVRVDAGIDLLAEPSPLERAALDRISASANVRLACQTRPSCDIHITPLLEADHTIGQEQHQGGVSGEERDVVAMFVDLRGSTQMGENHLPYDVLFILNQFFIEMSAALKVSDGHYAQFAGDGLMALYGLESGLEQGCRDAIKGAIEMQARIDVMNQRLGNELKQPLRIGIGIHCGEAIVGTMGPVSTPIFSAIGDNINAAARLESHTKELACVLVISRQVVESAAVDFSRYSLVEINVRGKQQALKVYAIEDLKELARDLQKII